MAGVLGEGVFEVLVSHEDTQLQAANSTRLEAAAKDIIKLGAVSAQALHDANAATAAAGLAKIESGKAVAESNRAIGASSSALELARGAQQLADSFEKDIKEAKRDASEAKRLLEEARQLAVEAREKASEATEGVKRLTSPRSLIHADVLIRNLQPFRGTEYTFSSVFPDEESIQLLRDLDRVLQDSGWKRMKPPGGFPGVNVYGDQQDFAVPNGINTGIHASVDSLEELPALQSLPLDKLPMPTRGAALLTFNLSSSISPSNAENVNPVNVVKGESKTIRIAVGKKP